MGATISQVLTEINSGLGLTPAAVARQNPVQKACTSTVIRWIHVGVKGPDGSRIKLESAKIGGKYFTSSPAWERFVFALSQTTVSNAPPLRTPAQTRRAAAAAERELILLGS